MLKILLITATVGVKIITVTDKTERNVIEAKKLCMLTRMLGLLIRLVRSLRYAR